MATLRKHRWRSNLELKKGVSLSKMNEKDQKILLEYQVLWAAIVESNEELKRPQGTKGQREEELDP